MNILLAPNNYYTMPTIVLLQSLFESADERLDIYVIHSDLTKENIVRLNDFMTGYGGSFHLITIKSDTFGTAHVSRHITKESYYRLLAQELLPQDLDRILYLDGDLVVMKSLKELYKMSFQGADGKEKCFVVCEGPGVSKKDWSVYDTLGIPHEYPYFNAGVLLMNLSLLRRNFKRQVLFDFINRYGSELKYHDQDILNALFYDKVIYVDWHIYNQTILHITNQAEADARINQATVIHYAGPDKPWKINYTSWYFDTFWHFAKRAGFWRQYMWTICKRFVWRVKSKLK